VVATAPKPGISTPSLPVVCFTSMLKILRLKNLNKNIKLTQFRTKLFFGRKKLHARDAELIAI
jgi:hypothetical protein